MGFYSSLVVIAGILEPSTVSWEVQGTHPVIQKQAWMRLVVRHLILTTCDSWDDPPSTTPFFQKGKNKYPFRGFSRGVFSYIKSWHILG